MKHEIVTKSGEKISIKVVNRENPEEWSVFTLTVGRKAYQGQLEDDRGMEFFLAETTGYECDEDDE